MTEDDIYAFMYQRLPYHRRPRDELCLIRPSLVTVLAFLDCLAHGLFSFKFEYKKTLPGWEGSTVTLKTVQVTLRSFTNQHYPLGAKYYYGQKLDNQTKYEC